MKSVLSLIVVLILSISTAYASDANKQLIKGAKKGDMTLVVSALEAGAEINVVNKKQMTPLLYASHAGNIEMVKFLISKGADVNVKDKRGRTAIMHAAHKGNQGLINLLEESGAVQDGEMKMESAPKGAM